MNKAPSSNNRVSTTIINSNNPVSTTIITQCSDRESNRDADASIAFCSGDSECSSIQAKPSFECHTTSALMEDSTSDLPTITCSPTSSGSRKAAASPSIIVLREEHQSTPANKKARTCFIQEQQKVDDFAASSALALGSSPRSPCSARIDSLKLEASRLGKQGLLQAARSLWERIISLESQSHSFVVPNGPVNSRASFRDTMNRNPTETTAVSVAAPAKAIVPATASLMVSLTELGNVCFQMGDLDASLLHHDKALNLYLDHRQDQQNQQEQNGVASCISGRDHTNLMSTLAMGNLKQTAAIYIRCEKFREALNCYTVLLNLQSDATAVSNDEIATTLSNMGLMHYLLRNLIEAVHFYKAGLDRRMRCDDARNSCTQQEEAAATLNSIGIIYYQLNKLELAREAFSSALQFRQMLLKNYNRMSDDNKNENNRDDDAPQLFWRWNDIAMLYYNLASVAIRLGDDGESFRLFQRSIAIKKVVFGDHPEVAIDCQYIGQIYLDHGHTQRALYYYQEALNMVTALIDDNDGGFPCHVQAANKIHHAARQLLVIIGNIYLLEGDVAEMMASFVQAARCLATTQVGLEGCCFMESIRPFGYQLYSIYRMHPPAAAVA